MFVFVGVNNFLDNLIAKTKIISINFFSIPEFHNLTHLLEGILELFKYQVNLMKRGLYKSYKF